MRVEKAFDGDEVGDYDSRSVAVMVVRLDDGGVRERERLRERVDAH